MKPDDIFEDAMSCPITDFASVKGARYSEGEKVLRFKRAKPRELEDLHDACLVEGSNDTRKLVEQEQARRLKKLLPAWKTAGFWFGLVGAITGVGGLVVSIIALTK